mmetsp:Transcript_23023/g.32432  ORF Transcript_23023/g.32432 Transcript_23023/m.32432 type:complete len:948 (+) Transcript_23023:108-2951(+)|eukprot:CAMPEP_0184864688 /NCGR_PEP_ID=MMETSP0580-20130426/15835_1 /TAXON_ID=1118495 /ORGANISM="Dactyliosolen fragilissimus" /LENGTH=947 /DNA_ID=CAMNT_0027363591 /DNA_START=33 /DNA_END=2876 /DNA_ORIENTATION=+
MAEDYSVQSNSAGNMEVGLKFQDEAVYESDIPRDGYSPTLAGKGHKILVPPPEIVDNDWEDEAREMTFSRLVVEKFLMNKKWYNPNSGKAGAPSLKKAWAHFEHVTLGRRKIEDGHGSRRKNFQKANPGAEGEKTALYPVITTPQYAFREWGIGVALYFQNIRSTFMILLVAGLISIPNIVFFRSSRYGGDSHDQSAIPLFIRGSALCVAQTKATCESGYCNTDLMDEKGYYNYESVNGNVEVYRSSCEGTTWLTGMVNLASLLFAIIATTAWFIYEQYSITKEDEGIQTASDYSIQVHNPPGDSYDPEEWKEFFDQFSVGNKNVTLCTISIDNHEMLVALRNRRQFRDKLRFLLVDISDEDFEDEEKMSQHINNHIEERDSERISILGHILNCTIIPLLRPLGFFLPAETLMEKIDTLTEKIKELQEKEYAVSDVFITYESESSQRNAFKCLRAGIIDTSFQRTKSYHHSNLFRGERLLSISEPYEPDAIHWTELHVPLMKKIIQQSITFLITLGLVIGVGFISFSTRRNIGVVAAGIVTSTANALIPFILKLMSFFEQHSSEGSLQSSLYLKITIFRWVNTGIMVRILTPFTNTLSDDDDSLMRAISGILLSELCFSPFLSLLDIPGNIKKHFFAPRAKSQRSMNLWFQGTPYNLAERYTNFSKILFVCYLYSALIPGVYFIGCVILIVQYYVDKFSLLRIWKPAPFLGTQLAKNGRFFTSLAVVSGVIISSYDFAAFKYDNICTSPNSDMVRVCNDEKCCTQNPLDLGGFPFPAVPRLQPKDFQWMSPEQESVTRIFGWLSVAAFASFCFIFFSYGITRSILSLYYGHDEPDGEDQNIDFSNATDASVAYISHMPSSTSNFPVLTCDIDDLKASMVGFEDVNHKFYSYHNAIYDIPHEKLRRKERYPDKFYDNFQHSNDSVPDKRSIKPIYDVVKYWPTYQNVS